MRYKYSEFEDLLLKDLGCSLRDQYDMVLYLSPYVLLGILQVCAFRHEIVCAAWCVFQNLTRFIERFKLLCLKQKTHCVKICNKIRNNFDARCYVDRFI